MAPPNTRVTIPWSAVKEVSAMGEEARAWFNTTSSSSLPSPTSLSFIPVTASLLENSEYIHDLMRYEMIKFNMPSHRIAIGGVGQGGVMAIHAGLSFPEKIAGIVSTCGYVALPSRYPGHISPVNARTPLLAINGQMDPIVPIAFAKLSFKNMEKHGVPVDFRQDFTMYNSPTTDSLTLIHQWLTNMFRKAQA